MYVQPVGNHFGYGSQFSQIKKEMGLCSENAWLNTKTGWFSINKMEGVISTFLFCAC